MIRKGKLKSINRHNIINVYIGISYFLIDNLMFFAFDILKIE